MESNKYYVDSTINTVDHDKWLLLLEYAFNLADQVEFNVLKQSKDFFNFLVTFQDSLTDPAKPIDKIYTRGEYIRLELTKEVKDFIKSKYYNDWYNYFLEDISFLKNGLEFFATITHENYVIIKLDESDRDYFNKQGFSFEVEWPYPYNQQ
jgi:hypothetical protein